MAERKGRRVQDPDPRTLSQARTGDLRAFEDIVRSTQADVFGFAWHLTRDRDLAADVTQEAFLRAFRYLDSYRQDSRFSSWLLRITHNCAMDALSKRKVTVEHSDDARSGGRPMADAAVRAELDAALRAVSPDHRESFLLIEVLGLSYQEAADVLGVRIGTVKSRMFRARRALCLALADDENEETAT